MQHKVLSLLHECTINVPNSIAVNPRVVETCGAAFLADIIVMLQMLVIFSPYVCEIQGRHERMND